MQLLQQYFADFAGFDITHILLLYDSLIFFYKLLLDRIKLLTHRGVEALIVDLEDETAQDVRIDRGLEDDIDRILRIPLDHLLQALGLFLCDWHSSNQLADADVLELAIKCDEIMGDEEHERLSAMSYNQSSKLLVYRTWLSSRNR